MPDLPYPPGLPAIFEVVRRLRSPDGCPWDREQTHRSLRQYLLEETYELLEAIDRGDDRGILDELGDVLLQVAMHAAIAEDEGRFDAATVSEAVASKMVSRHPHVFGDKEVADAAEVLRNWEQQKAEEARAAGRGQESVLDRVTPALPALAWALALQKRAARVGFDVDLPLPDVRSAAAEAAGLASGHERGRRQEAGEGAFEEVGDLLFAMVALSRKLEVNPEDALRAAGQRFKDRFRAVEGRLRDRGVGFRDMASAELESLWAEGG